MQQKKQIATAMQQKKQSLGQLCINSKKRGKNNQEMSLINILPVLTNSTKKGLYTWKIMHLIKRK